MVVKNNVLNATDVLLIDFYCDWNSFEVVESNLIISITQDGSLLESCEYFGEKSQIQIFFGIESILEQNAMASKHFSCIKLI